MEPFGKSSICSWREEDMGSNGLYPRSLTPLEQELLLWILPEDRAGFREYRACVRDWKVVAQGRRGEGNNILAPEGTEADNDSPLPQIIAFGVVLTTAGELSVTLRERVGSQLEFEISTPGGKPLSVPLKEKRRWTLSTWFPSQPCPICSASVREVVLKTRSGQQPVLAICAKDHRLWVYNDATGVNHPIPVTNIYNELVMQRDVREPAVVLDSKRLFSDLSQYTDAELARAFAAYNTVRTKIPLEGGFSIEEPSKRSFLKRLFSKA